MEIANRGYPPRGSYYRMPGVPHGGASDIVRIVHVEDGSPTLTYRPVKRWRWLEWIVARWEDLGWKLFG